MKNPGIAAVLSFLITGLGQIYNGQIGKGIGFVVVYLSWARRPPLQARKGVKTPVISGG